MKIINTLNAEQRDAALSEFDKTLVVASAGTGKTSTIMARIENLLHNGARPEEIMLITFTSKAASEMLERLERYFSSDIVEKITAGTFHATALKHISASVKGMKIIQNFEARTLLKNTASRVGLNSLGEERYSNNQLLYLFGKFQSSRIESVQEFIESEIKESDTKEHRCDIYEDLYHEFQKTKAKNKMFEFNDLLLYAKQNCEDIGLNKYQHLIVDEFQDTNPLQEALIDAITPKTLFCVGDYDQSIYGFNGADISIITDFMTKYDNSAYFNLKRNYRSAPAILNLAEKVISNNERIYPKELIAEYKGVTGDEKPQLFTFHNNANQFESIASYILSIPEHKRADVAILFRGNSSAAGAEIAMKELGIAYDRKSGSSFFDRDDVKIMLACLMISTGRFKFEELLMAYFDIHASHLLLEELYRALVQADFTTSFAEHIQLSNQDKESIFVDDFFKLRKSCQSIKKPLVLLEKVFNSKLFETLLEEQIYKGADFIKEDERKIEEKKEIIRGAAGKHKTIERFIRSLDRKGQSEEDDVQKVNLMSVHASKGLEFDTVFVVDLVEKMFPNQRLVSSGGSIEEERRLFYVAVTRAKNTLWLCYPKKDKKDRTNEPSIFLKEAGFVRMS